MFNLLEELEKSVEQQVKEIRELLSTGRDKVFYNGAIYDWLELKELLTKLLQRR